MLFSARSITTIGAQVLKRSNYSKGEGPQMVYHPTYTKQFRKTGNVSTVVTINRLCIRTGANKYSSKI